MSRYALISSVLFTTGCFAVVLENASLTLSFQPGGTNAPLTCVSRATGTSFLAPECPLIPRSAGGELDWTLAKDRQTGTKTLWIGGTTPSNRWTAAISLRPGTNVLDVVRRTTCGDVMRADTCRWALLQAADDAHPASNRVETLSAVVSTNDAAAAAQIRAACRARDWDGAMTRIDRALAARPDDARLYVLRAFAARKRARGNADAVASGRALRLARKADPLNVWAQVERAYVEGDGLLDLVLSGPDFALCPDRLADCVRDYRALGAETEANELGQYMKERVK